MTQEIQRHITNIYDGLDKYCNSRDLRELFIYRSTKYFKYNETFLAIVPQINEQVRLVTHKLTQLSESIDDLEMHVNKCKHLVLLEKEKNHKFANFYEKYHVKLNKAKNE